MLIKMLTMLLSKWPEKWVTRFFNKLYSAMTFGFYVRTAMETYQFLIIWCTIETFNLRYSSVNAFVSLSLAFITLFMTLSVLVISMYQYYKLLNPDKYDHDKYFQELFNGIKFGKISGLYSSNLLIRRVLLVLFLMYAQKLNYIYRVIYLCTIQTIYLILIVKARPFKSVHSNI